MIKLTSGNHNNGRITIDGHEELRVELDALRRLVRLLAVECETGRKYNYYGDPGSKDAYLVAIKDTGDLP